jgi:hypothetical protein
MDFLEKDEFSLYKNAPNYTETRERMLHYIKENKQLKKEEIWGQIAFYGFIIICILFMVIGIIQLS